MTGTTTPAFLVRPATLQDTAQINEIFESSYTKLLSSHYGEKLLEVALPFLTKAQPKVLESGTFYLAETTNKNGTKVAVGCGGWTHERPGSGEVVEGLGHIRHFGVHPDYTRKGIGRLVFQRCADDAAAQGVTKFECYSSLNGETFYNALGFQRIGTLDVQMGPDLLFPAVVMTMELV